MSLKQTERALEELLQGLLFDLKKAMRGNKSAAQRVRTGSIEFAKTAKLYRKESVQVLKSQLKRTVAKKKKKTVKR